MSIISNSLIRSNLNFAIGNVTATLTAVTPTNDETYAALKQGVEEAFEIFDNGRETTIDTQFYIAKSEYTTLPRKGMILTDGTTNYKVINTKTGAINERLRIDCEAQHQR